LITHPRCWKLPWSGSPIRKGAEAKAFVVLRADAKTEACTTRSRSTSNKKSGVEYPR